MAQRKRIALIFTFTKEWMGGTYYLLNLIKCLNTLPDNTKPEIILLCGSDEDFKFATDFTEYPYLKKHLLSESKAHNFVRRAINKIARKCLGHELVAKYSFYDKSVDVVYPVMNRYQISTKSTKLYWIPDLQEKFMPHLFSEGELAARNRQIMDMVREKGNIVFSSHDAKSHFLKFYPKGNVCRTFVLHFASKLKMPQSLDDEAILAFYKAPARFFYCSNQFWVHKNHRTLFKAVKLLKERGESVTLYCSGGTNDYRNPGFYESLVKFINENDLAENIRLLGFFERRHQVALMRGCLAIVQPSLFEGWNTSVEEAKSLNKLLILSDIDVHKEQANENVVFFKKDKPETLADAMSIVLHSPKEIIIHNYDDTIREVGERFIAICSRLNS